VVRRQVMPLGAELQRTADETWAFFDQFLKAKKK
jgi:hypothetical protein